jgi:UDP-N-acetylmuramoyl-tripeptide--D-alanyl-D-alanine ligase
VESTGREVGRIEGMPLTAASVAEAMRGRLVAGRADREIPGFSIDSRTLTAGDLFFAIRGERFDGHRFVAAAFEAGACGVVVSDPAAVVPGGAGEPRVVIAVADTVRALQALGHTVRRASGAKVVAVTGSVGKTTTKEAAAAFLAGRYRVFRSAGNLNNHIGLPLSLLELRYKPEVAVVELGMNHAGEIRTLVALAEPDLRVWTNVAEVHTAFFPSLEAIADAKAELLEGATPRTVLVANRDDPLVMARVRGFPGSVVTFGTENGPDVRASQVRDLGLDGTSAQIGTAEGEDTIRVPLIGRGNLANVLAAAAAAMSLGVPLAEVVAVAERLTPAHHRGEIIRLASGVTLVDDSYNSNPRALCQALEVIAREPHCARRVAVLGEMLELGASSVALHQRCGRLAAQAGLQHLITIGGEPARALARAAVDAGMPADAVEHVATSGEAAGRAVNLLRPGDLVLVKGSHGVGTDLVVDRIKGEFA